MLETSRLQLPDAILFGNPNHSRFVGDLTYAGNLNPINSLRQARYVVRVGGEEQLEILAAVQCQSKRIERAAAAKLNYVSVDGKRCGLNQRADIALSTKMREIGRLIAEIVREPESEPTRRKVQLGVRELAERFPLYAKRLRKTTRATAAE